MVMNSHVIIQASPGSVYSSDPWGRMRLQMGSKVLHGNILKNNLSKNTRTMVSHIDMQAFPGIAESSLLNSGASGVEEGHIGDQSLI